MPTTTQSSQVDIEIKFISLINTLKSVVEKSKMQSEELYLRVDSLYGFQPKSIQEKEANSPIARIPGIITDISDLILELDRINNSNRYILDHFGELI